MLCFRLAQTPLKNRDLDLGRDLLLRNVNVGRGPTVVGIVLNDVFDQFIQGRQSHRFAQILVAQHGFEIAGFRGLQPDQIDTTSE